MKNLAVNTHFCSSCIENELNNIKEDIINIFSEYVEPLMKEINQLELLQEWKINLDVANYERNIDNKFNRFDSDKFWPTSIKDRIQWFLFLAIMEHTANITEKIMG